VRARGEEAQRGEANRGTGSDTETCLGGWLELTGREGGTPCEQLFVEIVFPSTVFERMTIFPLSLESSRNCRRKDYIGPKMHADVGDDANASIYNELLFYIRY
jgi:hypothetical protein